MQEDESGPIPMGGRSGGQPAVLVAAQLTIVPDTWSHSTCSNYLLYSSAESIKKDSAQRYETSGGVKQS